MPDGRGEKPRPWSGGGPTSTDILAVSRQHVACRQLTGRSPANGLPDVLNIYTAWTQAVSRGLWLS